jgi:2-acylglycerol O-acyltransferase 2/2-acylglycerol O-acyltransferase 1
MIIKKVMGFTIPLFHARGVFNYDVGLMPYRSPVNVVVGRPIKVVQQGLEDGAVDADYLDEVHGKYMDELVRLWENHKDTFAPHREDELEIAG